MNGQLDLLFKLAIMRRDVQYNIIQLFVGTTDCPASQEKDKKGCK